MDLSDKPELRAALDRIERVAEVSVPGEILRAYLRGEAPEAASYEKLVKAELSLPAVVKHMLVAESYLVQPAVHSFYDIYRAARSIPLLRALDSVLARFESAQIAGFDSRLRRLAAAKDFDDFDAVLLEIAAAAQYGAEFGLKSVEFVAEDSSHPSPDLRVALDSGDLSVECKRLDRMTDATVAFRNEARDIAASVLRWFLSEGQSAVVEVVFATRPSDTDAALLCDAARDALRTGKETRVPGARVVVRPLQARVLVDYAMFPGPAYFFERYGYLPQHWHGVVPHLMAKQAGPSFLDGVSWEAAMVWRIEDQEALWAMKRLGFTTLFKGLEQLRAVGTNSVLHVWAARDLGHGHRQQQLVKLVETLHLREKLDFSWMVINETVADVSVRGRFDFQEHASWIPGRYRRGELPPVTSVFIGPGDDRGPGEWGIGMVLPPIDDEF